MRATALSEIVTAAACSAALAAFHTSQSPTSTDGVEITVSEGTSMAIALSPDKRTLVIDLQGGLWSLPVGGGTAKRLTDEYSDARQPSWSPDGRRIAYQGYRDGASGRSRRMDRIQPRSRAVHSTIESPTGRLTEAGSRSRLIAAATTTSGSSMSRADGSAKSQRIRGTISCRRGRRTDVS